jgi:hypothetical protein
MKRRNVILVPALRPIRVECASRGTSLIDVLDRVIDKGIVIDGWVRVSMVGIDLITAGMRVVVASIEGQLARSYGRR